MESVPGKRSEGGAVVTHHTITLIYFIDLYSTLNTVKMCFTII